MTTTISTENGEYTIFQAAADRSHADGDIKAGEWQYQPSDWQGDVFSPGYATRDEAVAAAEAHAWQETAE
jgi:hypothetical protein